MKYIVRSTVVIETVIEMDDTEDIYAAAGDYAGDEIARILNAADVGFDFCDDYEVYDEDGVEVECQE
jgi:hypothetical protein